MLKYIFLIHLVSFASIAPSYANDNIIWKHHQYITKEIDGGKLIATINFTDDGKFKGTVKGTGHLEPCEVRFWGKGTKKNNPLYSRFNKERIFF